MTVAIQQLSEQESAAFLKFEVRALPDSDASIKAGHPVYKDVDFAIIRPSGTETLTVAEKEAEEWLQQVSHRNDPFYAQYKAQYDAWKANQEDPTEGTPIRMWPSLTPSQVEQCLYCGIRSVEDLASADDEQKQGLGVGGQALINRAKSWLETANDAGVIAEQNAALTTQVSELEKVLTEKDEEIKVLSAMVEELEAKLPKETKAAPKTGKAK